MSYSLEIWLGQQLRDVEEDGTACAKIVLRSVENGTPWQTWRVGPGVEGARLLEEIQGVLDGLAEQFPVGKNQVVFVALDQHENDFSRFPTFIFGKNKAKGANELVANEASQAIAQTMTSFAETFRAVLGPVNAQFGIMMKHTEALQQTVLNQSEYIRALQEERILKAAEAKEESGGDSQIMDGLKQFLPVLLEMAGTYMAKQSPAAAAAVNVAAHAAAAHSNGAAPPSNPTLSERN